MAQTIERVQGESGNPITGVLNNKAGTLTIPNGTPCTVTGTDIATGLNVFADSPVTINDYGARTFTYEPAANDWETVCTVSLQFKLDMASGKPVYLPDSEKYELLLQINPRRGS